jgi:prophage DNA circulation protein
MPWDDRLIEAAYTGPDGVRRLFIYTNVGEQVTKRTSTYDFPNVDGTYVQDLGHSGRRYQLKVIISGPDHDLEASAFMNALLLPGVGVLEHPMYGVKRVVPTGSITRRDDLVSAANQSVFEVTFWETVGLDVTASDLSVGQRIPGTDRSWQRNGTTAVDCP